MAKSTRDRSSTSDPTISPDLFSVISSPASADGRTRCGSPTGPTIDPSGRDRVRVSRGPRRTSGEIAGATTTRGISGRRGTGSSTSDGLASCLASRLRATMGSRGSTAYRLISSARVTPSGRRIFALQAFGRTDGSGFSLWPTPHARDHKDSPGMSTTGINPDGSARARLDRCGMLIYGATFPRCAAVTDEIGLYRWLMGYPQAWTIAGQSTDQRLLFRSDAPC